MIGVRSKASRRIKKSENAYSLYVKNIVLAAIVLVIVMISMGLYPFGNKVMVSNDLGAQYYPFFQFLRDNITEPWNYLYTFSNGVGSDNIGLFTYYLLSPFNLIVFLFPKTKVLAAIYTIIGVKLLTIVGTMTFYIKNRHHIDNFWNTILSIGFALGSYSAMYYIHFMWLDILVWLPLVIYGLQKFIDNPKNHRMYQITLGIMLFSNYYIGWWLVFFYSFISFIGFGNKILRNHYGKLLKIINIHCFYF